MIEIYRSNAFVSCSVAFTQLPPAGLAPGKLGNRDVSATSDDAVPRLVLRCQTHTKVVEGCSAARSVHVRGPDARLADCGDCVIQVLVGEQ